MQNQQITERTLINNLLADLNTQMAKLEDTKTKTEKQITLVNEAEAKIAAMRGAVPMNAASMKK